jgi:hypothetical protein
MGVSSYRKTRFWDRGEEVKRDNAKPPHTKPPLTELQMSLLNSLLNRDWTWFGAKRFRPAPDQNISVIKHIQIVFWGSIQTTALLTLGLLALYQLRGFQTQELLAIFTLAILWAVVALHLNFQVHFWNRRALTLQGMAKAPLERFYLAQNISIPNWDTIVQSEREKEAEQQSTSLGNTNTP